MRVCHGTLQCRGAAIMTTLAVQLTGDLPADWSTNSSKFLQHLYLSRNNFTGAAQIQVQCFTVGV